MIVLKGDVTVQHWIKKYYMERKYISFFIN